MRAFWHCFVPLFVAVDALGVLPMFIALTENLEKTNVKRAVIQSVVTATAVAILFLTLGRLVLQSLGIAVADFMIAGGLLLFGISIVDLLTTEKKQRIVDTDSLGAVPIGVPLIVGPAVLTTSILLVGTHGLVPTISALIVNIALAGMLFSLSEPIHRILGKAGSKTVSKLASILLASIAVMMVRKGITEFVTR